MKKSFRILLTIVLAVVMLMSLTACVSDCAKGKHSFVDISEVPATCTSAGNVAYKHCIVCDLYFDADGKQISQANAVVPKLGHDPAETAAKAPSCTADGNVQYWQCSRCDKKFSDENCTTEISVVVVNKTGHVNIETVPQVDATCVSTGVLAHKKCIDCDALFLDDQQVTAEQLVIAVDSTAHAYGEWQVTTDPTCIEKGEATRVCSNNSDHTDTREVAIDKDAHDIDHHEAQVATCTEIGWDAYDTCSRCDYTTYHEIPALGHKDANKDHNCDNGCDVAQGEHADGDDNNHTCDYCNGEVEGEVCHGGAATCENKAVCDECGQPYGDALGHTWSEWTVTTDPTCSSKGEETRVCSNNSDHTDTREVAVDKDAHDIVHHEAKAETCKEGEKWWDAYDTCSRCDYSTKVEKDPVAHTPEVDEEVAPTCEETGLTEGSHCDVCGAVLVAQEEVPANGHTYSQLVEKTPATCLKTGMEAHYRCDVCQGYFQNDENKSKTTAKALEIPVDTKDGHSWTEVEGEPATCTEAGYTAYRKCQLCETEDGKSPISAKDHDYGEIVGRVAPTCNSTGRAAYYFCDNCQTYFTSSKVATTWEALLLDIDANAHDKEVAWTSDENGHYHACANGCSQQLDYATHSVVTDQAVEQTCTAPGKTEGSHCGVCNKVIVAQQTIDASGHKPAENYTPTEDGSKHYHVCENGCGAILDLRDHKEETITGKDPTCTESGLTDGSKCVSCGHVIVAQQTIQPNGHNYGSLVAEKPATCSEKGFAAHYFCDDCDTYFDKDKNETTSENLVLAENPDAHKLTNGTFDEENHYGAECEYCDFVTDAEAHNGKGEWLLEIVENKHYHYQLCGCGYEGKLNRAECSGAPVDENVISATCTKPGSKDLVVYCSICNAELSRENVEIPVIDHSIANIEKEDYIQTPATCTTLGTYYKSCSVCGEKSNDTFAGSKLAPHTYGTLVNATAPTCSATGTKAHYRCNVCEGYFFNDTNKTPTDAQGIIVSIDVNAHSWKDVPQQAATCTEDGYSAHKLCTLCDETSGKEILKQTGHTEVIDAEKAPTCTETGLTEGKHCEVCTTVIVAQETIDALGHSYQHHDAVTPTCTSGGNLEYYTCSVPACTGLYFDADKQPVDSYNKLQLSPNPTAHAYGEWQVTTDPTCTDEGEETRVCANNDSHKDTRKVAVDENAHNIVHHEAKAATCTEIGWDAYDTCSRCDYSTYVEKAKLGHTWTDANCTTPKTCSVCGATEGEALDHVDTNKDHNCDRNCGKTDIGTHADENIDHKCDYGCEVAIGTCEDTNKDHDCDYGCGQTYGDHADSAEDKDHVCDYGCGATLEDCSDVTTDDNHNCDICGKENVTDHDYNSVVTNPTCTAQGYTTHTCSVCGDNYKDAYLEATDHAWTNDCDTECNNGCGTTREPTHTEDEVVVENKVDATCTADGSYDNVVYCKVCEDELSRKTITVDALGHTEKTLEAVAPTCTETGLTEGKHCSVCNEVLVAQTVVDALGHDYGELVAEVSATCEEDGLKAHYKCAVCDAYFDAEQNDIDYDDLVIVTDGHSHYYEDTNVNQHTIKCHNCDYSKLENHVNTGCACGRPDFAETTQGTAKASYSGSTTNMTGGDDATKIGLDTAIFNAVSTKANGGSNHVGLNQDGQIRLYKDSTSILTISVEDGYVIENVKVTLDTTTGTLVVKSGSKTLTGNNGVYAVNSNSVELSNSHSTNQTHIKSIEITYSQTTFTGCQHDKHGRTVTDVTTPATCTTDGFITYTCTYCEATWTETTETALDHQFAVVVGEYTDETHTVKCGRADCSVTEQQEHSFDEKQPIKNDDVYHNIVCACGKTNTEEHTWNEHTCECTHLEPRLLISVDADGRVDYKLSVNNPYAGDSVILTINLESIPDRHNLIVKLAGSDEPLTLIAGVYTLENVQANVTFVITLEEIACDHPSWTNWQPLATDNPAYATYHVRKCTVCETQQTAEHDITNHTAQNATCEAIGWDAYDTCGCGYTTYKQIEALGHNYGELVAEKPATCSATGMAAYYQCDACEKYFDSNKVETTQSALVLEVVAYAHNCGELVAEVKATCQSTGVKAHYQCELCEKYFDVDENEVTYDELIIDVDETAHVWKYVDTTEQQHTPTCDCSETKAPVNHNYKNGVCEGCGKAQPKEAGWYLVEVVSELNDGDKVIIVVPSKNMTMDGSAGNYREGTSIEFSNIGTPTVTLTLGKVGEAFTFKASDSGKYLSWSSGNSLSELGSVSDAAKWTITISGSTTTIAHAVTPTRKLQWNASSPRFACYTSEQTAIAIYKYQEAQGVCTHEGKNTTPVTTPATCTTDGSTINKCDYCGKQVGDAIVIPATDHTLVYENITETQHTVVCEKGDYSETVSHDFGTEHKCVCGREEPKFSVTIDNQTANDSVEITLDPAESEDAGVYAGTTVTIIITGVPADSIAVAKIGEVEITLTENIGEIEIVDANITVVVTLEQRAAEHEHIWENYTDNGDGTHTAQCSVQGCGNTLTEEHNEKEISAVDSTCTQEGKTAGAECQDCGCEITAQQPVAKKDHIYETFVSKTDSQHTYKCNNCDDTDTADHNFDDGDCVCGQAKPALSEKTATLSFASTEQRTAFSTTQQVWAQNGITLTNDKASSTSAVADYAGPARFYKSSKITITAPGKITKIVFTCNSSTYATALNSSINGATASGSTVTITLDGTSNTFTIASLSGGQVRMDSLTVTYLG